MPGVHPSTWLMGHCARAGPLCRGRGRLHQAGLIRHLAAPPDVGGTGLRVGLNWYLAPDEAHNQDGKHIAYLQPGNRWHASLAELDPDLMRRLAHVVGGSRTVRALEASGALPVGAPTHAEPLDPVSGRGGRRAWHRRALDALRGADVVLADPDNGLSSKASGPKLHKYALVAELADYAGRGQSLVGYHHADRSRPAETQAVQRLDQLATGVGQVPIGAIIARRGSCRFFLVTAAGAHRELLSAALSSFATRWATHAELVAPGGL
jgi:hypothetical protein